MAATLAGKTIVVVGGSSGIGYGVAKASLLAQAAHVIVVSTSAEKGARTVERLRADVAQAIAAAPAGSVLPVTGTIAADTVDAHDLASVRALCERLGEVDHFIWTSGDPLRIGFPQDLDANRGMYFPMHCPTPCAHKIWLQMSSTSASGAPRRQRSPSRSNRAGPLSLR